MKFQQGLLQTFIQEIPTEIFPMNLISNLSRNPLSNIIVREFLHKMFKIFFSINNQGFNKKSLRNSFKNSSSIFEQLLAKLLKNPWKHFLLKSLQESQELFVTKSQEKFLKRFFVEISVGILLGIHRRRLGSISEKISVSF